MKTTLIEKRTEEGQYGMDTESMILDTDTMGRILITEGWGGDDVNGYCYRWRNGMAIQLKDGDTFEVLAEPWNDYTSTWQAMAAGHDPERPILRFNGYVISAIANRHQTRESCTEQWGSEKQTAGYSGEGESHEREN